MKKLLCIMFVLVILCSFTGCELLSEADKVNSNISKLIISNVNEELRYTMPELILLFLNAKDISASQITPRANLL